ncbi:SH3 domain-containing protein [Microbacterium horticulturae]|uniref:SH3 domain-containing protein n=1 Tax=Microbacterium horticulturae TaxID=3028316 RepID=A0ABY8BUC9_9MICO|nr:SH3 domain-containing protein [Microbacterium sp. KACC 23027]WEG07769.1 SH3 domain-containing protein [Microbacterium sp. KACC 23027]
MLPSRSVLAAVTTAVALVISLAGPVTAASAAPHAVSAAEAAPPQATVFRTPLKAESYTVSSFYGGRCMPLPGASTFHLGVDLAAPEGRPIYAVAAGVVVATVDGTSSRAGYVKLRHRIGTVTYTSIYYHIWKSTTRVKVGQLVSAGQRISEVGASGGVTGSHLHLEIWKGEPGSAVSLDPVPFMKAHGVDLYGGATAIYASKPPATCTYYTTTAVNFRTGPSTAYSSIRTLPIGTSVVHVPGQSTAGFLPVKAGSTSGWISSSYLSPNKPVVPKPTPEPAGSAGGTAKPATSYKTTAALNLRASASLSGKVVLVIPRGASVGAVKANKGTWRKITYKKKTGWVSSAYLTTASSTAKPAAKPATTPATPVKKATTYKTTAALNLRKAASMSGTRVLVIPRGANVGAVKATQGVWRKVAYKGKTGWVHSAYLAKR